MEVSRGSAAHSSASGQERHPLYNTLCSSASFHSPLSLGVPLLSLVAKNRVIFPSSLFRVK